MATFALNVRLLWIIGTHMYENALQISKKNLKKNPGQSRVSVEGEKGTFVVCVFFKQILFSLQEICFSENMLNIIYSYNVSGKNTCVIWPLFSFIK